MTPETPTPEDPAPEAMPHVSFGDLAFVLDVLIPRAWVAGREVDALVQLRTKLKAILRGGTRGPAA